jgi:hypothetical protein
MLKTILIIALATPLPAAAQAVTCQAQPDSPACSRDESCTGSDAVDGGNYMGFSLDGNTLSLCEAVMCLDGKVTLRRSAGGVQFVSGLVRRTNPETNRPEGPIFSVSAMIDRQSSIAHVAWDKRGIMMKCN